MARPRGVVAGSESPNRRRSRSVGCFAGTARRHSIDRAAGRCVASKSDRHASASGSPGRAAGGASGCIAVANLHCSRSMAGESAGGRDSHIARRNGSQFPRNGIPGTPCGIPCRTRRCPCGSRCVRADSASQRGSRVLAFSTGTHTHDRRELVRCRIAP